MEIAHYSFYSEKSFISQDILIDPDPDPVERVMPFQPSSDLPVFSIYIRSAGFQP